MSFRHVVRESKFRNIFGTLWKRDQCYDNIRVSKSSWDSTMCAVNPKFLAVIVESAGGGAFIVFPLKQTGRIPADFPLVGGHKGPVLDIQWCPHNDNIIASGSEDCLIRVWQIPDLPLSRTLTEPLVQLDFHQRRVGLIQWHPSAQNVLLSVGSDNTVVIWDVEAARPLTVIDTLHPDTIFSAAWNYNGSEIVTTCKDKVLRIINPRSGELIAEAPCHDGTKATRAIFLKSGLIFTTGFSKMSERQYSLRSTEMLADPIVMTEIDTSNGLMFPVYDADHNLVYLCGKGDSVIRYYEITAQNPYVHYINQQLVQDPQRGFGFMPKRGLNASINEIARFYRLNNNGFCQIISFQVPRKSERFQQDLYPPTAAQEASIMAIDWFQGKNADPALMTITEGPVKKQESKPVTIPHRASGSSQEATDGRENREEERAKDQQGENHKLKTLLVKHENRIRTLETDRQNRMKFESELIARIEKLESELMALKGDRDIHIPKLQFDDEESPTPNFSETAGEENPRDKSGRFQSSNEPWGDDEV